MEEQFIWALGIKDAFRKYETHPHLGLAKEAVTQRLADHGLNQLPKPKRSFIKTYITPLMNSLIILYLIAALVMLIAGRITGNMNIIVMFSLGMVGLNIIVSIFQQARATKKMEALRELSAPTTTVIRQGEIHEILSKNLVVGDLLQLKAGDRIPADARIISSSNLHVNEASLTGESEPVHKNHGEPLENKIYQLQNQKNILFFGTFITTGKCRAIVYATGEHTEIGQISKSMEESQTGEIPIRQKLDNMGKIFAIGMLILWGVTLGILFLAQGTMDKVLFIQSLEAVMNMLPVNIPILITIIMLTGVLAMADHGVIIRNISSVDSLGRVSVICTDKTGTLTKSQMCVQHIWVRGSSFRVTGSGYDPHGKIYLADRPSHEEEVKELQNFPHLDLLLTAGLLNNNAILKKVEFEITKKKRKQIASDWKVVGSATEGALITLAKKGGISELTEHQIRKRYTEVYEYPFSSDIKRMTKVFKDNQSGKYVAFTKGASEQMILMCDEILSEHNQSVNFAMTIRLVIINTINTYAVRGYRILSLGYKEFEELPENLEESRDLIESDIVYIGFVAIMDPPRPDVKQAVMKCKDAGVEVKMITGDALPTAIAIAQQVHIANSANIPIMEGNQLEEAVSLEDPELSNKIQATKVFSRVLPKHKEIIVENLQKDGKVAAMTGDGVNDALALNMADAGVAMGIQGTDVAKEAADMVISDDSFGSIVEGIRRGRGIYANIRSIAFFYICINIWEGLIRLFLPIVFNLPYFNDPSGRYFMIWLLIAQIIHTWPAFILTFDNISDDVMKEKPRNSQEIISKEFVYYLLRYGVLLVSAILIIYFLVYFDVIPLYRMNTNLGTWNDKFLFTPATEALWNADPENNPLKLPIYNLKEIKIMTMVLCEIFVTEFVMVLQIRRPNKSLWRSLKEDMTLTIIIEAILVFGAILILMYIPGLQITLFENGIFMCLMFLTFQDWVIILGVAFFVCILPFEFLKKKGRENGIHF